VAAAATRRGVLKHAVTNRGVPAYEIRRGLSLTTARVTDRRTGELVLTITGQHYNHKVRTQHTFEDGRVMRFPVYESTERWVGVSKKWRRFGVMYAVDQSGVVLTARLDANLIVTAVSWPEVVVYGDPTRERLLIALLSAPLLANYLGWNSGE